MDTFESIRNRHSYRGAYLDTPVPREDLRKILEVGLAAPSGCNTQTTSLVGLDDPMLVATITDIVNKNGFGGGNAPAGVCVLTRRVPAYANVYFNVQDYSAAIENMLLAVTALGYASCWVEGHLTENAETQRQVSELLNIPQQYTLVAFLPIGVPKTESTKGNPRPAYKPFSQRAWYNIYEGGVTMEKTALVLLADGFEEVEAVTPIDYLRRAGVAVTMVAIGESLAVKGARGITLIADVTLKELVRKKAAENSLWDAVVIPGGMPGAPNIAASRDAGVLIVGMAAAKKLICAICASPAIVLAPLGIISDKRYTCYPNMEETVQGGRWSKEPVVVDGNIITSRGAGTAGLFSIAIIGQLVGKAEADKIAKSMLLQ